MRLDPVFDSFYVLGSLWGALTGPQVCLSSPQAFPTAALEIAWSPGWETPAPVTAFVNVNVVPMDRERVLADQTVLVEGGRITALGPSGKVQVPAGAVRIDGRSKYLMPGLANMHYHNLKFREDNRALQDALFKDLVNGVTAIRSIEGPSLEEMQKWRSFAETAEVPTPRLYLARALPKSLGPDSVAMYVAATKVAGYHHLGTPFSYTFTRDEVRALRERAVFDSLLAAARRAGLPVSTHNHRLPFDAILALGATGGSVEHLSTVFYDTLGLWKWFGNEKPPEPTEVPMSKIAPLAGALKQAGVWVTPTLDCHENNRQHKAAVSLTSFRAMVKALQDAGVGLLLSGDDGGTVHDELAALVRAGLTPYQALLTGTHNPAQYFRLLDSAGTVAVGKHADLVLLNGNPLADIRHTRGPAGVMVAGRWFDRATLDQHRRTP
jgi:imidazolonepropionase-like amidohydrolase